jgi:hypothetical protein
VEEGLKDVDMGEDGLKDREVVEAGPMEVEMRYLAVEEVVVVQLQVRTVVLNRDFHQSFAHWKISLHLNLVGVGGQAFANNKPWEMVQLMRRMSWTSFLVVQQRHAEVPLRSIQLLVLLNQLRDPMRSKADEGQLADVCWRTNIVKSIWWDFGALVVVELWSLQIYMNAQPDVFRPFLEIVVVVDLNSERKEPWMVVK